MKPKTILTVVILAFVAVAVGYLVVKEVRAARAPEVAREGVSEPAPVATGEQELETGDNETAAAPATVAAPGDEASDEGTTPAAPDRKVVVTYYYTSKR
jgi:Flp pilus assembly protein CpaB